MLGLIVHATEQHILKGHSLSGAQRHLSHRFDHLRDAPFPRHGHDSFAHPIVRRIQGDCEFRSHRLCGEPQNTGHNSRRRYCHPRLGNLHLLHQQAHRRHKSVVVQERLTHTHEDKVDSIAARFSLLPLEDRRNLSRDLARRQVADDSELRRQAELAVDRAANLA